MPITIDIQKDGLYLKGYREGYEEGYKEGYEEGKRIRCVRTVEICLKHGISIELTSKVVKLSIDEVKEIQKRLKDSGQL